LLSFVFYPPHGFCKEKKIKMKREDCHFFHEEQIASVALFPHILNSFGLGLFEEFLINLLFKLL